jgi:hypothetical protein
MVAGLGNRSEEQARRLAREMTNQDTLGVQDCSILSLHGGEHLGCCGGEFIRHVVWATQVRPVQS